MSENESHAELKQQRKYWEDRARTNGEELKGYFDELLISRAEVTRLETENLQLVAEVQGLADMNQSLRSQRAGLVSGEHRRVLDGECPQCSGHAEDGSCTCILSTPSTPAEQESIPPAETLPVCPKCGKAPRPKKDRLHHWCDGTSAFYSHESWLRYCAENTPCRESGDLPSVRNGGLFKGMLYCDNPACDAEGNHTPAEWLDKNPREEREDEKDKLEKVSALRRTGPDRDVLCEVSDEQVAPPRAEALSAIRTELERWHFSYPERERGGFGRCVALFLDWAEAWEADHE